MEKCEKCEKEIPKKEFDEYIGLCFECAYRGKEVEKYEKETKSRCKDFNCGSRF